MSNIVDNDTEFGISLFIIQRGHYNNTNKLQYTLQAPTTQHNIYRILRSLIVPRSILLEGSPGVGKSSLVTALAKLCGHNLVRINLSEQTDIMDLLGSDVPVSGGKAGQFVWNDGILLRAVKNGDWVLLDELNLASQSVLEGLNSLLDHRTSVYIPELNQTYTCPSSFRIFAAQNPQIQGGGRKGLPASFLNRFTKVYIQSFNNNALYSIVAQCYSMLDKQLINDMIEFNNAVVERIVIRQQYSRQGNPYEFNLRDIFRWCDIIVRNIDVSQLSVDKQYKLAIQYVDLIYLQHMIN